METNLVSLVMQFLTPDMITRIAAALGLDRDNAQKAVGAAVPSLLAGLGSVAATPGGAQSAVDAVRQQSGVLDGFANVIGGGTQSSLVEKGSRLLTSLLGDQDQSALTAAVAKFSNIGSGTSNSLLGLLAPVVMGVIGKQFGARGPDASGLANLLSAQKDQIARAMPAGFGNLLGGTGLLDALGGAAGTAADASGQVKRAATAATGQASQYAMSAARTMSSASQRVVASPSVPGWVYLVVPLAVIAGLLWYVLGQRAEQATQSAATAAKNAMAQSLVVGGVDVAQQIGDSVGSLRTSLQGITDVASANAALPKLQEITTQVEKVSSVMGQLSSDQRKTVARLVAPAMPTLNQSIDKVLAIPGVGEVLRPTVDALKTKLSVLAA